MEEQLQVSEPQETVSNTIKSIIDSFRERLGSFEEILTSLIEALGLSQNKKFTFLLLGRTGVGKSSTINSLMGREIAPTDPFEATTMEVKAYEHEINEVQFTVFDTPGLCDDLEEQGNDQEYLEAMRSKINQVDLIWFVTPLNETRVRSDEKRGIRLISEAFGSSIWEHSIIVFTFADKVEAEDFSLYMSRRTELIRQEIAKYTISPELANNIPSVAVNNGKEKTPDGKTWLGELYTKVFTRISERGTIPFLLATTNRIKQPNWQFYNQENNDSGHTYSEPTSSGSEPNSSEPKIDLNDDQKKEVKKKLVEVIPALAMAGATIGAAFGPIGAAMGGAIGAGIGLIAALW